MLKGLFSHVFAKVVFVLCTYGIHLYLGKRLSAEEYGVIGVVISIITVNYNFLSNGARQAASKLIASKKYDEKSIIKKSVSTQFYVAMILSLMNFCGANFMAEVLNTPQMGGYIRLSAIMVPFTAGYFICLGIINGYKLFVIEAIIVTIYPILRLTIIPYIEFICSDSAVGTIMGFFTAAAVCLLLGIVVIWRYRKKIVCEGEQLSIGNFFSHMSNFLLFFTCVTIILNADMLFVNAYVENEAYVGYYTGAVNLAKVSYYLLSAIYLVVLPVITQFYSLNQLDKAKKTIIALNNAIVLLILPIVSIVGATTNEMLSTFYKPEYANAAMTATILMCSQFFVGLFVVINMCISASKERKFSTVLAVCVTMLDLCLCFVLVQKFSIIGVAVASLVASSIGCGIAFIKVHKVFGKIVDFATFRLLICNILLFFVISMLTNIFKIDNLIVLFLFYAVVYFAFICLMSVFKVVNVKDIIEVIKLKNKKER